jgi:UDP-glucuronate 4-epimerase
MKKILVTGGAGFIGSNLCESLCQKGDTVICADHFNDFYDPSVKRRNIGALMETQNFVLAEGDIRDMPFLKSSFAAYQPDMVIHLAAYAGVRPSIAQPELYMDVNVMGTLNVLECVRNYGVRTMVFASSSSVYGNNKKVPFAEDDFVDNPISPYAASKKAGELLCYTYHSLYGIKMACLRFFTVYGRRQRPDLAIHKFVRLIHKGQEIPFFGDGASRRDYTHIDDILDGILKTVEWLETGDAGYEIFNLGESNTITLKNMVETIERKMGRKAKLKMLPPVEGDVLQTYADISKAKRMIGYSPHVEFEQGLSEFLDWFYKQ